MCELYSSTNPALYDYRTRSVRISGVVTSVRLEERFWQILDEIAASEERSTAQFLGMLYDEVIRRQGQVGNFASLLRVVCTLYLEHHPKPPTTPKSRPLSAPNPALEPLALL